MEKLVGLINAHAQLSSQWDEMEKSDVEFFVSGDPPKPGAGGDAGFNKSRNRIDIKLGNNQKDISLMAHEIRHGYGYLIGEMVGGGNGLYDQMDEVVAYQAGFLFANKDAVKMVKNGGVAEWFKTTQVTTELYKDLAGSQCRHFKDRDGEKQQGRSDV
ncbi:hypothetical protein JMG10_25485 [Nostoc ellipsosporum NOK]|nr:hypothetical protein [Nostoc ellipsosporum NOK]